MSREIIIMQPGPLHLFFTTGVFYLWQLKSRFDFVFFVAENYRDNEQFQRLIMMREVVRVEYFPETNILQRHRNFLRISHQLLKCYSPSYLLMHNLSYPENQYLVRITSSLYPKCLKLYFQNGRLAIMWKEDFAIRQDIDAEKVLRAMPRIFRYRSIATGLVKTKNNLSFFLNYKLIPFLVFFRIFSPPLNVYTGNLCVEEAGRQSDGSADWLLTYFPREADVYREQGYKNVAIIQHPCAESAPEVFRYLYGNFDIGNNILIVPSVGYTSRLRMRRGWDVATTVEFLSKKWISAIGALLRMYPNYRVTFKLHPGSHADPVWGEIINNLCSEFGDGLQIIRNEVSAEFLVIQSRVVVGDVTTVLWWAALYGKCTVISLDIFNYHEGDEMKYYSPFVHLCRDLTALTSVSVSPPVMCTRELKEFFDN